MAYQTAWYVQRESDGYHIVRDTPQHGAGAFEYHDHRTYATEQEAAEALNLIKRDLAAEDALHGDPGYGPEGDW